MAAAAESDETAGGILGALKSPDWPTRRGAAEAVAALLYALGPALDNETVTTTPLVDAIEARLRERGFDKVRPARDAVHVATSLVRALRRYGEERLPAHDVAAWRLFARGEVGEHVASVGEEGRDPAAGETRATRGAPVQPVELVFEDEGHSFNEPENAQKWFEELTAFLAEHNPPD